MQDFYTFIVDGEIMDQDSTSDGKHLIDDIGSAMGVYAELTEIDDPHRIDLDAVPDVTVYKSNPADNTCYDVTGQIAELAFEKWDDDHSKDDEAVIPAIYQKWKFERAERYDDNREHAADYRKWAV